MYETVLYTIMEIQGSTQRIAESALRQAVTDPESFEPGHVQRFVRFFEHGDQTVRLTASWTLGLIVSASPETVAGSVKPLAKLLESTPKATHPDIVRTLGYIETVYPKLVRETLEELELSDDAYKKRVISAVDGYEPSGEGKVEMTVGPATEYEGLGAVAPETNTTSRPKRNQHQQPTRPPTNPPPTPPPINARRDAFEPVATRGTGSHVKLWQVTYDTDTDTHTALFKQVRHPAPPAFDTAFTETLDDWQAVDDHDAIVPVVSYGTIPKPWFVVEYQEGRRLSERMGSVGVREACWIIDRLVDAVVSAHSAGVLHGGISPRHVIFSRTYEDNTWEYPKLSNWGIPRLLCQLTALPMGVPPRYAAPEQIESEQFGDVDASTDIYHLGVIVYELLAGRVPFEGHPGVVLRKITTHEPPPPSYYNSAIPESVDIVVRKALRKSKLYRYNTAQDFQTELRDAIGGATP